MKKKARTFCTVFSESLMKDSFKCLTENILKQCFLTIHSQVGQDLLAKNAY